MELYKAKDSTPSIMIFPTEVQTIINDYAKPASAMLREDWREGSSIIKILKQDRWFVDFKWYKDIYEDSWVEWCKDKMIIGPPRHRSSREEAELDEDYLTMDDIIRHCRPWSKTWPHPDDHSWCKVRAVPDWAVKEFLENK
ncbi:MAG: hypothetical protein CL847_07295 [Crocinitomicaceae bacterium]|nr:hypothetical protein [Crocinitomicaceae bacterium]